MARIDLHCYLGTTPDTRALSAPDVAAARAYADQGQFDALCFSAPFASFDLVGGNSYLAEQTRGDKRFRAWMTASIHRPELSGELARLYLVKPRFCGTLIEQKTDADLITSQGGRDVLNALRRYSRPVLLTATTPANLEAAVAAAREFATLKFAISPQTVELTRVAATAIKEVVNTIFVPVVSYAERDVVASAMQTLGERRVAWSSGWGRFSPVAALGMARDSSIGKLQQERFLFKNASELLVEV